MPERDSSRRPGRPKGSDTASREKLLYAALTAFARLGYEGARLRDIAAEAGFDVSMIAHHFGSKAELWTAVVDELRQRQIPRLADFDRLAQPELPLAFRLSQGIATFIDQLTTEPDAVSFVTRQLSEPGERLDYLVEQLIRPSAICCTPLWQEAMEAGIIKRVDPVVFHLGLFGGLATVLAARDVIAHISGKQRSLPELKEEMLRGLLGNVLQLPGKPG
ncbi:TetR family transcriptional regulator [Azoarcus sp. TTM-91]|uniref:TetR/AcrR family transcriptional regulator n=1 Tax=Azoarcus sp. TTM-91 TaxID=2691581 RepID=UPI00145DE7E5|nr:TetR family transcriptional regulator [Azoarcus sp. TTM-91]NMG36408.1 TetR family transcriptional regulator [Azoarcus sp. TTM-91]